MNQQPRHRVGRAGRTVTPGRQARQLAAVLATLALLTGVLALVTWHQQADLRDIDGLTRAAATVTDVDDHRRRADTLHVDSEAGGVVQRAGIPYGGSAGPGDEVFVAYVPDAPTRVRTVEDWAPAYGDWTTYAVMTAAMGAVTGGFGLLSRWRRSRWESDDVTGELPVEELGRRVVRGSPFLEWLFGVLGLLITAGCVYGLVVTDEDQVGFSIGIGLCVLFTAASVAGLHWYHGRDGVWATDAALVARRRGQVRSWPWSQVHELGVVVDRGMAAVPAARVDDGLDDGIDTDGWISLARPVSDPFAAHTWGARFRRLADERDLPFTEGLTADDPADSLFTTYVRHRSPRRAGPRGPEASA